jgi:3-isopropylmalate/(R)-2-methylmalate dehydratase small subunit
MTRINRLQGRAVPAPGDDIDTDRILPARYMKEITFANLGLYPFQDERYHADGASKRHPFNEPRYLGASMLFGNSNFGCGSSREQAPQALYRWGIRAIVAESFGEIFAGNCLMLGIPAVMAAKADMIALQEMAGGEAGTEFELDLVSMTLKGRSLDIKISMPASRRKALLEGSWDGMGMLMANAEKVAALARRGTGPHRPA